MLRFKANRPLRGDYGRVAAGEEFEVPEFRARHYQDLEARGIIERVHVRPAAPRQEPPVAPPMIDLKALVGYENKAIVPEDNKLQSHRVTPRAPVRAGRGR